MRFSFFLVLFALSVLNYETVNCGLVKGFFEKVHETAHNAREHIEDTLHLRNKETEDGSKTEKVETSTPKKWEGEQPTEQKIETTTKAEVKPAEASKKENLPEIQSTEEPKKESKTDRVETVEPKKDDSENPKEQKVETKPTEEPKKDNKPEIVTETITSTTPASIAPAANDNSKDGRENFKGACIAGYQRTPDGRCKPTF